MSYNSKYSGQQVENLLDQVANGNAGGSGGGITTETDPIFSASPAAKITDDDVSSWNNKVDKVDGKQLSTEDFTTLLKQKLDGLSNYDDTEISQAVSSLRKDLGMLVNGNVNDAINSFNEIIAFLDGIKDNQDLSSIIASIEQQIASKMDKVTLASVATSGSYNDLTNKPTIPSAVTESTVSGWGFTKNTGTYSKPSTGIPKSDLASAVQTSLGKADTALQSHQDISGKQDKLISGTNIKTINGESILGEGDITISGGGSGETNEDLRYFTEFTVEIFKRVAIHFTSFSDGVNNLLTAAKDNKIICIPFGDATRGYIIAQYNYTENYDSSLEQWFYTLYISIVDDSIYRCYFYGSNLESENIRGNGVSVLGLREEGIEAVDGEANIDVVGNVKYNIIGEINYLGVYYNDSITVASIVFYTSDTLSLTSNSEFLFPNGVFPTIEPHTCYELSISTDITTGNLMAILTPFKPVES